MKRVFSILMILTLLFSLAACSNNGANEESSSPTQQLKCYTNVVTVVANKI